MTQISPTFETVFTEEYWGRSENPESHEPDDKISKSVSSQMDELTAQAAEAIFTGSPRRVLPSGLSIEPSEDNFHTLPGTVLLVDFEGLLTGGKYYPTEDEVVVDAAKPFYSQKYIHGEGDLMASPSGLFTRNSVQLDSEPDKTIAYPYSKSIPNPELGSYYGRAVRLVAYGVDKRGNPANRIKVDWNLLPGGQIKGIGTPRDVLLGSLGRMDVGGTHTDGKSLLRIKSAEICLSGTIEYAKKNKKVRRGVFAGRLALGGNI